MSTESQSLTIDELIEKAVGGDHSATAQVLIHFSDRLLRRLESRLKLNPFADFSAEDVLQETFVDVYRGIETFDRANGTPFVAWLNRVADNRLATFLRERSRIKRGGRTWRVHAAESSLVRLLNDIDDGEDGAASGNLALNEAREAIDLCLASLPDQQREVVQLYYLEQRSLDEIAEALSTTKESIRGLIYRARKAMRSMMGNSSMWFQAK